jgi:iron complex outermembrane receptor protein
MTTLRTHSIDAGASPRKAAGRRTLLLAGAAAGLLAGAGTAPALARAEAVQPGSTERIIVTARRREENLQDTPVSIVAFTGESLDRRQVFSTDSLDQVTPNLQFGNNAPLAGNNTSSQVFIRGIGQTDPTSTTDPGVGLYIDDVYIGQSVGGTMDFRDIANVQVLRGPQGTLFGRNTIGGAVVLTTNAPGDVFGGEARVRTGSDNLLDAFAAVDAPLGDALRSRFTFGLRQRDGYVTRVQTGEELGDTDTWTATAKFDLDATENFSARLQLDYTRSDENGSPLVFAAANETQAFPRVASFDAGCPGLGAFPGGGPVPMIDDDRCANDFQNKGPFSNNGTFPLKSDLLNWGGAVVLEYEVNDQISLKSVTSRRELSWEGIRDADNTPLTILHTSYDSSGEQWSQEFQLTYESDRLAGVAGVYYFEEEYDDIVTVQLHPPPGIQLDSDNTQVLNDNWALFTQWTFDVTDQLALTLGGRYTEDTKGSIPDQFNYNAPAVKYLPVQLYEQSVSEFTPSATVSYRWSPQAMTYLSYSEGFKGGGWNSHFNRPQTPQEIADFHKFGPEFAETIEAGFKLDLLDNTMRLNGAVFTTDYTDLQFTYRVGVAPYLANAGEASIDGFEVELTWLPGPGWTVDAGLGYLDAQIDTLETIAGTATGVAVGNKLPFTPEWQGNAGVGYIFDLASGWSIQPRVDAIYQTETFFDANNTPDIAQLDTITVLNASVTLASPNNWRLFAGVNNATDEIYPIAGNSSLGTSSGYSEIAYNRGREWFLGLSADF